MLKRILNHEIAEKFDGYEPYRVRDVKPKHILAGIFYFILSP